MDLPDPLTPASGVDGAAHPFTEKLVQLTQAEHIELKCQRNYWERQHARLKAQHEQLKQELSTIWGRPIGKLDEFPDDRFGWLNARELMGHDPAWWEFNITPNGVGYLSLVGLWEFSTDPSNQGEKKAWHSGEEIVN